MRLMGFLLSVSQAKISYSLLREIAMMMEDPVKEVSKCGVRCCVEIKGENGEKETRVLEIEDSVPSPNNACEIYRCEVCKRCRCRFYNDIMQSTYIMLLCMYNRRQG